MLTNIKQKIWCIITKTKKEVLTKLGGLIVADFEVEMFIASGLGAFFSIFFLYNYARVRKITTDLKKYKKIIISSKGIGIREIAEKILNYNVAMKLSIEGDKLIFQDKLSLSSLSWGKMYIITAEESNINLYYRNTLGFYNVYKFETREMENIIKIIVS